MGRWGKVDFSQFKDFQKKLQRLSQSDITNLCTSLTKEISARLLRKTIKRTPVGEYKDGRKGGTLRRGWTVGKIKHTGNTYEIEIVNPVEYAMYVEYGHRTRNHKGWVPGRFMLTLSEKEIENMAPKLIEQRLQEYLEWCFNDK